MNLRFFIICFFATAILLSGCEQRYWFRNKVRVQSKRVQPAKEIALKTIHFNLVNKSPAIISKSFEEEIEQACLKKLRKKGYVVTTDTPQFIFNVSVGVASFTENIIYNSAGDPHLKRVKTKGIEFYYNLTFANDRVVYWEKDYDLYFLNKEKRDINRSVGVSRYCINRLR